jgi:hypothetical protein
LSGEFDQRLDDQAVRALHAPVALAGFVASHIFLFCRICNISAAFDD